MNPSKIDNIILMLFKRFKEIHRVKFLNPLESTPNIAGGADSTTKGRCFNDSKVSAHHAIIPTGVVPKSLDKWEQKVYDMIAIRYIIQFYPSCKYDTIRYEIESQGHVFAGSGKAVASPGWRSVVKSEDKEDEVREVPTHQRKSTKISAFYGFNRYT